MVQEWEGRVNGGMSNSVTTAIRGSVRDMAIGKIRNTEKADRATVEQVKSSNLGIVFCIEFLYSCIMNESFFPRLNSRRPFGLMTDDDAVYYAKCFSLAGYFYFSLKSSGFYFDCLINILITFYRLWAFKMNSINVFRMSKACLTASSFYVAYIIPRVWFIVDFCGISSFLGIVYFTNQFVGL